MQSHCVRKGGGVLSGLGISCDSWGFEARCIERALLLNYSVLKPKP